MNVASWEEKPDKTTQDRQAQITQLPYLSWLKLLMTWRGLLGKKKDSLRDLPEVPPDLIRLRSL